MDAWSYRVVVSLSVNFAWKATEKWLKNESLFFPLPSSRILIFSFRFFGKFTSNFALFNKMEDFIRRRCLRVDGNLHRTLNLRVRIFSKSLKWVKLVFREFGSCSEVSQWRVRIFVESEWIIEECRWRQQSRMLGPKDQLESSFFYEISVTSRKFLHSLCWYNEGWTSWKLWKSLGDDLSGRSDRDCKLRAFIDRKSFLKLENDWKKVNCVKSSQKLLQSMINRKFFEL